MRSFIYVWSILVLLTAAPLPVAGFTSDLLKDFDRVRENSDVWFSLDWENDAFLFSGSDRYYTNGLRLTWRLVDRSFSVRDVKTSRLIPWPTFNQDAAAVDDLEGEDENTRNSRLFRTTYGMRVGQNMYTPSDITLPPDAIDPMDRPYGAWLYAGAFKELYDRTGRYWRYGLDVGCIGPCAQGEQAQKFVHEIIGSKEPVGWDSQARNELGVVFHVENRPAVYDITDNLEVSPKLTANIGNIFLNGSMGGMVRFGRLKSLYFGPGFPPKIDPALADARQVKPAAKSETVTPKPADIRQFYLYVIFDARLVAYNALLEGGLFRSHGPHTVSNRPVVFDTELGIAYAREKHSIIYSRVMRSTEVREQDWKFDHHKFGRVHISFLW